MPRCPRHAAGLALTAVAALVAACGQDRWEGFAHPYPEAPGYYEYVGTHPDLESCQRMGYAVLSYRGALGRGHYECGRNCAWDDGGVFRRCEAVSHSSLAAAFQAPVADPARH